MRRGRGYVVLAAIFIAIFLFFLSVALIWTNRQDIALTLSLEHRLKAESAARSAAFEAFARLRQIGTIDGFSNFTYAGGATAEIELLRLAPEGKRGDLLLLRSKGTSGPLNSYLTLYLQDIRIAGEENSGKNRVLFLPTGSGGKALFGDFLLKDGGDIRFEMVAQGGPAFVPRDLAPKSALSDNPSDSTADTAGEETVGASPPYFVDYLPIFPQEGQGLRAWGPAYVVAPPFGQLPFSVTSLQYLKSVEDNDWTDIPPPEKLGDEDAKLVDAKGAVEMPDVSTDAWSEGKIRGIGDVAGSLAWMATKPETMNTSDLPSVIIRGQQSEISGLVDWSEAGKAFVQNKYVTRGMIAANGRTVYSHGWHYLYRPYSGSIPNQVTPLTGSTLTRWPCILKYEIDGNWSIVWDPLKSSGSVNTDTQPDPNVLAVTENGTVFTVTAAVAGQTRRLITISDGGKEQIGPEVPFGTLFTYQNQAYLAPQEQSHLGLLNILDQTRIDFSSLPNFLPEVSGEIVDTIGKDMLIIGLEGGYQGEPLDTSQRVTATISPRFDIQYSIPPAQKISAEGKDLWLNITVTSKAQEPSYPKAYTQTQLPEDQTTITALARYDGVHWHVFPHGLRSALRSSLSAPGNGAITAVYSDLPKQVSRYSVVAIDTSPFEKGFR